MFSSRRFTNLMQSPKPLLQTSSQLFTRILQKRREGALAQGKGAEAAQIYLEDH